MGGVGNAWRRLRTHSADTFVVVALMCVHACLAIAYLRAMPLFNWPDEPAHFNYVRRLATGGGLDVMDDRGWSPALLEQLKRRHFLGGAAADAAIAGIRYEAHQPPLYYGAAALVYAATGSPTMVKLLNVLLSCTAIVIAFLCARRLSPNDRLVPITAATLLALVPMRCFMAVSISNDIAAEALFGGILLGMLSGLTPFATGILIGIGALTKTSLLLTLPLFAAWCVVPGQCSSGAPPARARPWRDVSVAAGAALLVASPWIIHNGHLYGWSDPFAIRVGAWVLSRASDAVSGEPRLHLALVGPFGIVHFARLLFESWWGVYGWMEMFTNRSVLAAYLFLTLVPVAGLAASAGDALRGRTAWRSLLMGTWLALAIVLAVIAVAVKSLHDFQPQGRYVMVVSAPIAVLYAIGMRRLLHRWAASWVWVTSVGLLWINVYVIRHVIPWYLAR